MGDQDPARFGPYRLLRTLGHGAYADVYLAAPIDRGATGPALVVLKRLHLDLLGRGDALRRFEHEARIASRLAHPNLVTVVASGHVDNVPYMAMDYVDGWSLAEVIERLRDRGGGVAAAAAIGIVADVLRGLEAIHTASDEDTGQPLEIVHRDLSPRNVVLGRDGRPRLIDLGLGRSVLKAWKTQTGTAMGSLGYMAPEQVVGEAVDARADLYSIGVLLFELLTLRSYIPAGPSRFMLMASVAPEQIPPSQVRDDLGPDLDAVVMKAIALSPDARYQSAAEMLEAVSGLGADPETRAAVAGLVEALDDAEPRESRGTVARLTPDAGAPARERRPGGAWLRRLAWLSLPLLLLGILASRVVGDQPVDPPAASPPPAKSAAEPLRAVAADPAEIGVPAPAAVRAPQPAVAPRRSPAAAKRRPRAASTLGAGSVPAAAPALAGALDSSSSGQASLRRLIERATAVRQRLDAASPLARELDALIVEMTLERGSRDDAAIAARLPALTDRLRKLEASSP